MANICENRLRISTCDTELFAALSDRIIEQFDGELIWENTDGEESAQEIFFTSHYCFPIKEFQTITATINDPSLVITVVATEPMMDYVGHFVYQQGVWMSQPLELKTISPNDATGFTVLVNLSRPYTYTQEQMTERLGKTPSAESQTRIQQAQQLAWEDLRQDFEQQKITADLKSFDQLSEMYLPESHAMEAISV